LAEQWQDELYRRFHLPFEILTNDKLEAARTGNWFLETNLVIARLDKLSRNCGECHQNAKSSLSRGLLRTCRERPRYRRCRAPDERDEFSPSSLDHLVGAAEQRQGDRDAERLGGLQIDDQLDF
jgi:hypothetical protein